jgi:hypothetical protein
MCLPMKHPSPYGPDELVEDLSRVLVDHGFTVDIKATSTSQLRYHAASLLHLMLGGSPWESPPKGSARPSRTRWVRISRCW